MLILSNLCVGEKISLDDFVGLLEEQGKERWNELGKYVFDLEKRGYIKIPAGAVDTGGKVNSKYDNNVCLIYFEKLRLTPKGVRTVETDSYDEH
ncbi:hypothetical protein D3C74_358470 [compost metagenome]